MEITAYLSAQTVHPPERVEDAFVRIAEADVSRIDIADRDVFSVPVSTAAKMLDELRAERCWA